MNCEVIVFANSSEWYGLQIFHDVMTDPIDSVVHRVLASAVVVQPFRSMKQNRVEFKPCSSKPTSGRSDIRGNRHIMNDDSDINATRHARALVGGVVSAVVGRTDNFVSGGGNIRDRTAAARSPPSFLSLNEIWQRNKLALSGNTEKIFGLKAIWVPLVSGAFLPLSPTPSNTSPVSAATKRGVHEDIAEYRMPSQRYIR